MITIDLPSFWPREALKSPAFLPMGSIAPGTSGETKHQATAPAEK